VKEKANTLRAGLKVTTQRLKNRIKTESILRRALRDKLRARDKIIARQKEEIAELKKITEPQRVPNCVYPVQMMVLAVFMVVNGCSLRCTAKTVGFYSGLMGWKYKAPTFKTVSNWVQRCGLHALNLQKNLEGEYVGIIDASIQMGREQLLLLLGVPLEAAAKLNRPLEFKDVEVLGMEVSRSWKGDEVQSFIERILSQCSKLSLRYFVCDKGTNLRCALRAMKMPVIDDCSHVMMNLVKRIFKDDAALSALCASVGRLRSTWALTDKIFLLPPTLRDKDRFLRVFTLVEWMNRIDTYCHNLPTDVGVALLEKRNYWLDLRLRQVHHLLQMSAKILKCEGLCLAAYDKWIMEVIDFVQNERRITKQAKMFMEGMQDYFESHLALFKHENALSCCSDIIESTFGRYKNKGGMKAISADVLVIALYNQKISVDFVHAAMQTVKQPKVNQWKKKYVCQNRYGQRKQIEKQLNSGESVL